MLLGLFARRALVFFLCCVISILSLCRTAMAADAEDLIRRGNELRRQEKDAEALVLFQQAYEQGKAPKALVQVGLAEQALGKWGSADRHLRTALQAPDDAWVVKHRKTIEDSLAAVGRHVGRLDVRGGPAGAEVRVDGEVIGKLPLPAPFAVTAGGVAVEVRAEGHVPILRATTVPLGILIRETFELQPLASPAATPPAVVLPLPLPAPGTARAPDDRLQASSDSASRPVPAPQAAEPQHSARPTVALVLTALAVGAVAVGVVEHVTWQKKVAEFDRTTLCDPHAAFHGSSRCDQLWADGVNAELGTFIGYGVGAGLLTTAVILFLTDPSGGSAPHQVACAANPFQVGAGCSVRF